MRLVQGWFIRSEMDSPNKYLARAEEFLNEISYFDYAFKGKRTCIQAGGHIGCYPRLLATIFEYVWTFEPFHKNFECLRLNCQLQSNIRVSEAALGNSTVPVQLSHSHRNTGKSQVIPGRRGTIPMERIDDLGLLGSCDLIQLDIEGLELGALMGAEMTVKNYRPVICVENNGRSRTFGHEPDAIYKWMEEHEYVPASTFREDVIFIPKERMREREADRPADVDAIGSTADVPSDGVIDVPAPSN